MSSDLVDALLPSSSSEEDAHPGQLAEWLLSPQRRRPPERPQRTGAETARPWPASAPTSTASPTFGAPVETARPRPAGVVTPPMASATFGGPAVATAGPLLPVHLSPSPGGRRSRSRDRRRQARWDNAREEVDMVLEAATSRWRQITAPWQPLVGISRAELARRAHRTVERQAQHGRRAYIGSSSDPAWRWEGGWYWPSDDDRRGATSVVAERKYMEGHLHNWDAMVLLGAWPDREAGQMEEAAISVGRSAGRLTNIADDARGLAIRAYGYSFVYCCYRAPA